MTDPASPETPAPTENRKSPLDRLAGEAGCMVTIIVLGIAVAAGQAFNVAVQNGAAWAGAAAVAALGGMGVGVVYVLTRTSK